MGKCKINFPRYKMSIFPSTAADSFFVLTYWQRGQKFLPKFSGEIMMEKFSTLFTFQVSLVVNFWVRQRKLIHPARKFYLVFSFTIYLSITQHSLSLGHGVFSSKITMTCSSCCSVENVNNHSPKIMQVLHLLPNDRPSHDIPVEMLAVKIRQKIPESNKKSVQEGIVLLTFG